MQQRRQGISVSAAVHAAQNLAVAVLQGQIDVFDDLVLACHHVDQLVRHAVGIAVENADPAEAVDFAQLLEQLRELRRAVQILSVAGGVLSDDVELFHALRGKLTRFLEYILHRAAAEPAADQRNRAVGAAIVAALRDLEISGVGGSGLHSAAAERKLQFVGEKLHLVACKRFEHDVGDFIVRADADGGVDLIELLGDLVLIALGKAARDDNRLDFSLAFEITQLQNLVNALLLGGFDKAAGVHDHRVRLFGVADKLKAAFLECIEKHFGVNLIFGAAEGNHPDLVIHMIQSLCLLFLKAAERCLDIVPAVAETL